MNEFDIFCKQLPSMMDLSCVRANHTLTEICAMAALAKDLNCAAVFALPAHTAFLAEQMKGTDITVGGTVGFPSGADTTDAKLYTTEKLLALGCREIDMVIDQTSLKSGLKSAVFRDISAISALSGDIPLKVILEVNNLTDREIVSGCQIAEAAGAAFVKSGTGWHTKPTTLHHIKLMRSAVSDHVRIKAAGGITDIQLAFQMYQNGCTRFGVGVSSARTLLNLKKF